MQRRVKAGSRRQEAGGLAGGADAGDRVLDGGDDLGVAGLAEVAEARREVGGADEEAVDAVDGGDRLERIEAGAGLDLDEQAELLLGAARGSRGTRPKPVARVSVETPRTPRGG